MSNGDLDLSSIYAVKKLPRLIEQSEAQGQPVIVTWHGTMDEHVQKLFATLGVLVHFVPED
jgi:hypothetical protein